MRGIAFTIVLVAPLLLAACGDDAEKPSDTAANTAAPPPGQPAPPAPAPEPFPLRLTPEGLLGAPAPPPEPGPPAAGAGAASTAPVGSAGSVSAAPVPPPPQTAQEDADGPPSEAEVRALYEGVMYTYVFDACGLPLIGDTARKDIEERIEVCPSSPLRKDAFRTVYRRALEFAEQDPGKMRTGASRACPDKREFLRRVMSHAGELQFDDSRPPDCRLFSPGPPGGAPAGPSTDATTSAGPQKPF